MLFAALLGDIDRGLQSPDEHRAVLVINPHFCFQGTAHLTPEWVVFQLFREPVQMYNDSEAAAKPPGSSNGRSRLTRQGSERSLHPNPEGASLPSARLA